MKTFGEKEINAMQNFVSTHRSSYHIKFQQNRRRFYWNMGVGALISWAFSLIGSFLVVFMSRGRDFTWVEVLIGAIPFFMLTYIFISQGIIYLLHYLRDITNSLNIYDQRSAQRKISFVVFLRAIIAGLLPIFCIFPGALLLKQSNFF